MRSRYSAYALGGYGDYLLATWLPSMTKELISAELSTRSVDWVELKVLNKAQQGNNAQVEFDAFYRDQDGQHHLQHEKSVFKRMNGRWFYVGGEVS